MVKALNKLNPHTHTWIDTRTGALDDAAIVRQPGSARALVMTMDVITPIVDDPEAFGAIAAANSLSDVYAMGGRPEVALSFVGCPTDQLEPGTLDGILKGMHDACTRAKCAIVGGHTMKDSEPKCGLSVVGSIDPDTVWSQKLAEPGDVWILTKAIGTGLVGQSVKKGEWDPEALRLATAQMIQLNDVACRVGLAHGAHACTDITGFGLLGHLKNLVEASGVAVQLRAGQVPLLPGVLELASSGCVPGGTRRNLTYAAPAVEFNDIDEAMQLVLADAQTSGGLLLGIPSSNVDAALRDLIAGGCTVAVAIGEVVERGEPKISVVA